MQLTKRFAVNTIKASLLILLLFLVCWFYINQDKVFITRESSVSLQQLNIYVDKSLFDVAVKKMQYCLVNIENSYKVYIKKISLTDLEDNDFPLDINNYILISPYYNQMQNFLSQNQLDSRVEFLLNGKLDISTHLVEHRNYANLTDFINDIANKNSNNIVFVDQDQNEALKFYLNSNPQNSTDKLTEKYTAIKFAEDRESYYDFLINANTIDDKKQANLTNTVYNSHTYLEYYINCTNSYHCGKIRECLTLDLLTYK